MNIYAKKYFKLFYLLCFSFLFLLPTALNAATDNIVWIDATNNANDVVTVTGNSIERTTGSGWDGGAASEQIVTGDCTLDFLASHTNTNRMCGLSSKNTNDSYSSINYAIYLRSNATVRVYENGSFKGDFGAYVAADRFQVIRTGKKITYEKNGAKFYTSKTNVDASIGLMADTSFHTNGGIIADAKITYNPAAPEAVTDLNSKVGDTEAILDWSVPISNGPVTQYDIQYGTVASGGFASTFNDDASPGATIPGLTNGEEYQFRVVATNASGSGPTSNVVRVTPANASIDVTWQNTAGVIVTGNTLTKNVANSWSNAGGESATIFSGDGRLEFEAVNFSKSLMCGLSSTNPDNHYNTINYAIYLYNRNFRVYENGSNRYTSPVEYFIGDRFIIERTGTTVVYKRNGITFYTSGKTIATDTGLMADCSLYTNGGVISDARILDITPAAPGAIFNLSVAVGDTEAILNWTSPANNASAITGYDIQYGTVASGGFASTFNDDANPGATIPGLTNGEEYQFRAVATNAIGTSPTSNVVRSVPNTNYNVTWQDTTGVSVSGNTITKNVGGGWGTAGGRSLTSFSGNGRLEFEVTQYNRSLMCGLSSKNPDNHYNTINYAIYLSGTRYYVYENGSRRYSSPDNFYTGDRFIVERTGTTITYKRNGITFHTSAITINANLGLMLDCALASNGGVISDAKILDIIPGPPGPVVDLSAAIGNGETELTWSEAANNGSVITEYEIQYGTVQSGAFDNTFIDDATPGATITGLTNDVEYQFRVIAKNALGSSNLADCNIATITPLQVIDVIWDPQESVKVKITGNTITRNGGSGWNSGSASFQYFSSDGAVLAEATQTNLRRMFGLSSENKSASYNTIEYAIYLNSNSYCYVYEYDGSRTRYKGNFGRYSLGDIFSVEKKGDTVYYKKNSSIFYTSSMKTSKGMLVDSSIYDNGGAVANAFLAVTGPPGPVTDLSGDISDGEIILNWTKLKDNIYPVTEYEIQYGTVGSGLFDQTFNAGDSDTATITGLINETEYQFRVVAKNDYNKDGTLDPGTPSNVIKITPQTVINVFWIDQVKVNDNGGTNTITKTGGSRWRAGAASYTVFSGNGTIQFEADATNISQYAMCGLSSINKNEIYSTIEYALYMARGRFYVYEYDGTRTYSRGYQGRFVLGDILSVERIGDTVYYKKNDTVMYESLMKTTKNLMADCSIRDNGAKIFDAKFLGVAGPPGAITDLDGFIDGTTVELTWSLPANNGAAVTGYEVQYGLVETNAFETIFVDDDQPDAIITGLQPGAQYQFRVVSTNVYGTSDPSNVVIAYPLTMTDIIWTDHVNTEVDPSETNTVMKKADIGNSWNAGAASVNRFTGYGGLEFTARETNTNRMCGLSSINRSPSYNTIEYAIYLRSNKTIRIYEYDGRRTRYRGTFGSYATDDIFRVERKGTTVKYKKNGVVFYTSTMPTSESLIADCGMHTSYSRTRRGVTTKYVGTISNAKMFSVSSSIKNFKAIASQIESKVTLTWIVPTAIENPNFAGAMIRYSNDSYPTSINDGTLLGSFDNNTITAEHLDVLSEKTYYYSIFGYDGVPNYDSPISTQVTTPDLISPDQITNLTATPDIESIILQWTNPDFLNYPNEDFEGVMIRRDTSGPPADPTDGTLVAELTNDETTYTDTELDPATTYYYSLFTYDEIPLYSDPLSISASPLVNIDHIVIVPEGYAGTDNNFQVPLQISGQELSFVIKVLDTEKALVSYIDGAKSVDITGQYINPAAGNTPIQINGISLPSNVSLNFTQGISDSFTLSYLDAGTINITASMKDNSTGEEKTFNSLVPVQINYAPQAFEVTGPSSKHEIVGRPFDFNIMALAIDGATTTPNYSSTQINLSVQSIQSNSGPGKLSKSVLSLTGGVLTEQLTYDKLGTIKINVNDPDYLGRSISGESGELIFTPNGFNIELSSPPTGRSFFYIDELINMTMNVLDYNSKIIDDYIDTVNFTVSPNLNLPKNYIFQLSNQGVYNVSFKAGKEGVYDVSATDSAYSDITGKSGSIEVKYGEFFVESLTAPIGDVRVNIKIVDRQGKLLSGDNSTTFLIKFDESNPNGSATSSATTNLIQIKSGIASFTISNTEAETVNIQISSDPALPYTGGEIIFTKEEVSEVGKGGIRILFWKEVKE